MKQVVLLYRAPIDLKESERITQENYIKTIFDSNEDEIYLTLQLRRSLIVFVNDL